MVYASLSRSIMSAAASEANLDISKRLEASEPDELTDDMFADSTGLTAKGGTSQQESSTKAGFARPKRPGRR